MSDPTEQIRRELVEQMPAELDAVVAAGGKVWSTAQMQEEFEAIGFMAPFIVVKRRSDGVKGSLQFTHSPRWYFGWQEDVK